MLPPLYHNTRVMTPCILINSHIQTVKSICSYFGPESDLIMEVMLAFSFKHRRVVSLARGRRRSLASETKTDSRSRAAYIIIQRHYFYALLRVCMILVYLSVRFSLGLDRFCFLAYCSQPSFGWCITSRDVPKWLLVEAYKCIEVILCIIVT